MKNLHRILLFLIPLIFFFSGTASANVGDVHRLDNYNLQIVLPDIIMRDIKTPIRLEVTDPDLKPLVDGEYLATINGTGRTIFFENGISEFNGVFEGPGEFSIRLHDFTFSKYITPIPLWLSVLPPLIAIAMALFFKEVYSALFIGILFGAFIIFYYQGQTVFEALFSGFFAVIDTYILESMQESSHLSIIIFSMMIGGMVGVITKNGGMRGIVNYLSRYANNARSGQFVTWLLGLMIFFDDYANTLVVGNTMRPVTDRLRISREKLAYLVDSTAAPVASIAFVTTWIGAELSYIQNGIITLGLPETPYEVFINSLQYSFYPILAIVFIFFLVWQRRDFGPMYLAEKQVRKRSEPLDADKSEKPDEKQQVSGGINALIPVLVVVLGTIAGLIVTGLNDTGWDTGRSFSANLSRVIGHSDSFSALLWSSLGGITVAVAISISRHLLTLRKSINAMIEGFQSMIMAVLILVMAWSIALITEHLHTAEFISTSMVALKLSPYLVPALTFILAALVAFSTGSSWGTMAILYPLILPASWLICQDYGLDYDTSISIFHNVVSAVLAGSVLGDHCSPISDTTILSSLASSCDHIEHVRTQMPYALTVGTVGLAFGTIPAAYGVSSMILFPINIILLLIIIRIAGKKHRKVFVH